jgi:hypothetical protein
MGAFMRNRVIGVVVAAVVAATGVEIGIAAAPHGERPRAMGQADIPVPGDGLGDDLAVTPDSIYVLNSAIVYRIDRRTYQVAATSYRAPRIGGPLMLTGGTVWIQQYGDPGEGANLKAFGLDAGTLRVQASILLGAQQSLAPAPGALWSIDGLPGGRLRLVRYDAETGTVTRRLPLPKEACPALIAVDEQAGVVWTGCGTTNRMTLVALDLATGKVRGSLRRDAMFGAADLGTGGSLWALTGKGALHVAPDGARALPLGGLVNVASPGDTAMLRVQGSRLWLLGLDPAGLGCYDRASGELLATYPMPEADPSSPFVFAADDHELFTILRGRIRVQHGPDRCLS